MGVPCTPEQYAELQAKGLVPKEEQKAQICASPAKRKYTKRELLPSVHMPPGIWIVGIETQSLNEKLGSRMRAGMKWKAAQRLAVMMCMGKTHASLVPFADNGIHAGLAIRVTLTRLSPGVLDDDNLAGAMKHIRDAVADVLGVPDNHPLIKFTTEQQKSDRVGVRIEIKRAG